MNRKEVQWCPQHGYPLPCDKCGYSTIPDDLMLTDKEIRRITYDVSGGQEFVGYTHIFRVVADQQLAKVSPLIAKLEAENKRLKEAMKLTLDQVSFNLGGLLTDKEESKQ